MHNSDSIFHIYHDRYACTGLRVELTDLADVLKNIATQMLLDQQ
jgi:hypothetical protein